LGPVERRLFVLAQATVNEPRAIVIEDPLQGIDPRAQSVIMAALAEVTQGRVAILCLPRLSSRGPESELVRTASHVCLLRDGQLLLDGDPGRLLAGMGLFAVTVSRNAGAFCTELENIGARVSGGPLHFSVTVPEPLGALDVVAAAAKAGASLLSCVPSG
jgi:ABC-type multidrug transport system ATPase subunit